MLPKLLTSFLSFSYQTGRQYLNPVSSKRIVSQLTHSTNHESQIRGGGHTWGQEEVLGVWLLPGGVEGAPLWHKPQPLPAPFGDRSRSVEAKLDCHDVGLPSRGATPGTGGQGQCAGNSLAPGWGHRKSWAQNLWLRLIGGSFPILPLPLYIV